MNLNQVTVPTKNLTKAIEFYKKLGLQLIVHTNDYYARFVCPNGDSTFSLHVVDELPKGNGTVVYFEVEKLDEHVEALIMKGILFDTLPTDQRWLWREAHLQDPDGNLLILYRAGENRKNPPWRLKE
ncbi:MAG: VOC family protein [Bacteroidota bacterium]